MHKTFIAGALVWALLAAPAFAAQPSTLDRVVSELEALSKRVAKLEQDNATLVSANADLKQENDRLEATLTDVQTSATATSKQVAETAPRVATLEKSATASEWTSRLNWKGDFRYRHEQVDPEEASAEQKRQRIRARFGLTAKLNEKLSTTVQVATNGGSSDPRSTNQTLGDGLNRKGIGLDLAYADWKPANGVTVLLGKTPYGWTRIATTSLWDPDITWEGGSVRVEHGAFFGSAMGSWLSESGSGADASLVGTQLGLKGDVSGVKLLGAINYLDVGAVQGEVTTTVAPACTANGAFFGGPQGNSTFTDTGGCARLLNDFNLVEAIGEADFKLGHYPVVVFADFLRNLEADDFDTGYSVGFNFGKAADPGTWELAYIYSDIEKDSQFGQFMESDFGGGITDTKGSVFKFGYAVAKGWIANGTYFLNDRFVDVGTQHDYDRLQLDLNYKF